MGKMWDDTGCQEITFGVRQFHVSRTEPASIALVDDDFQGGIVHYVNSNAISAHSPYSPVTRLIHTLLNNNKAKVLTGNVIYTTEAPTAMCLGMASNVGAAVKQIAVIKGRVLKDSQYKQVDWSSWLATRNTELNAYACDGAGASPNLDLTNELKTKRHEGGHSVHRIYMMVACALITKRFRSGHGLNSGQNIGSILVSRQGEILAWGVNTNDNNHTYHAEVNMIQSYHRRMGGNYAGLPDGCRIYTTLKPCAMCAGMIMQTVANPGSFKVFYEQHDPSGFAADTALDKAPGRQSALFTGSHVLDIVGVETAESKSRVGKPRMSDQIKDSYRKIQTSKKVDSEDKRITAFLGDEMATKLFSAAATSLQTKLRKHGVSGQATGKELNPTVTSALTHLHGFLRARGVVN